MHSCTTSLRAPFPARLLRFARNDGRAISALPRREDHFLNVAQPVLAEENFTADEEGRRAESAALDRALRIVEQPRLDRGVLNQFLEALGIETRREQGGTQYRRIVELFGLRPHVPIDLV